MGNDPANAAYSALRRGDSRFARTNAIMAAKQAFDAAESASGNRRRQLIEEGEQWLELVGKFESKSKAPDSGTAKQKSSGKSPPEPADSGDASDSDWEVRERPDTRLSDLAGLADAKQAINEMILLPLARPDWAEALNLSAGGGVLLYGPPGNGKTLLGRAIAGELDVPFFYASGAQIRSKWHGESEQRLRQLMQAVKSRKQAVLFLDEVDGLLPRRSGKSVVDNRLVTQFLAELGGFEASANTTLVLGATNCPWEIDDAVFRTGRFDVKIYVGLPEVEARAQILSHHFNLPETEVRVDLTAWADKLDGYCGSDLVGLVTAAKRRALSRAIEENAPPVLLDEDLQASRQLISPSADPKLLTRYERFREARQG